MSRAGRAARTLAAMGLLVGMLNAGAPAARAQTPTTCFGLPVTIQGTANGELINGTAGPDVIHGGGGDDVIFGYGANDFICGGSGEDTIYGGNGNDSIRGNSPENDILYGEGGNDLIYGSGGNDFLYGLLGADQLYGEDGNDSIRDGYGADYVDGGSPTTDTASVGDYGFQCDDGVTDTHTNIFWSAKTKDNCNPPGFPYAPERQSPS